MKGTFSHLSEQKKIIPNRQFKIQDCFNFNKFLSCNTFVERIRSLKNHNESLSSQYKRGLVKNQIFAMPVLASIGCEISDASKLFLQSDNQLLVALLCLKIFKWFVEMLPRRRRCLLYMLYSYVAGDKYIYLYIYAVIRKFQFGILKSLCKC